MAIDVGATAKGLLPTFTSSLILWIIVAVVVIIAGGIVLWIIIRNMKYNKTIVIFKEVAGHWQVTGRTKAMEMRLGKSGDYIFLVKKPKKYLPVGNKQTGVNQYWYAVGADGHWTNISIEDINLPRGEVEMNMQISMDYARTGIQKVTVDRYDKKSWLSEHWQDLLSVGVIILMLVFIWLDVREQVTISQNNKQTQIALNEAQLKVVDKLSGILAGMDNICSGGSGIRSV